MNVIDVYKAVAAEPRFADGWPMEGQYKLGTKIPYFGQVFTYQLRTGNGIEDYTKVLRYFGWSVVFGVADLNDGEYPNTPAGRYAITLCQRKPGVNGPSWELPPGGIGKGDPKATLEEITAKTRDVYQAETGFGGGEFQYLGHVLIETGVFRGATPDDHGLPAHMYLATGLRYDPNTLNRNQNEIMEPIMVPIEHFDSVLESGLFVETSAVVCAYKALIALGQLSWSS